MYTYVFYVRICIYATKLSTYVVYLKLIIQKVSRDRSFTAKKQGNKEKDFGKGEH